MIKKYLLSTILAMTTTAAALGTSTAFAKTNNDTVTVIHDAYLIKGPTLHSGRIVLEKSGDKLTLLSSGNKHWYRVRDQRGHIGYITKNQRWTSLGFANVQATSSLPPGVTFDTNVQPLASRNASYQTKYHAVLKIAKSKLGTPYRWGHNEDRGQYGFDCSNFTAYVYHHALGYKMSGASKVQAHSVGWTVAKKNMRPGDLLIFEQGKHVGIYVGHHKMIQEGGGLGKVGYLSIGPGSYWGKHLSAVKRMF